MKNFYIYSFILMLFLSVSNLTAQEISQSEAEQKAQQLLNEYQAELGLTIEQALDFHQTIAQYLQKKSEVENKALAPDARKNALAQLNDMETNRMAQILDPDQLKMYKKLKPKIQPL